MTCTKCGNEGVKNQVFDQEFYYCRTCKVEIFSDSGLLGEIELEDPLDIYKYATPGGQGLFGWTSPPQIVAQTPPAPTLPAVAPMQRAPTAITLDSVAKRTTLLPVYANVAVKGSNGPNIFCFNIPNGCQFCGPSNRFSLLCQHTVPAYIPDVCPIKGDIFFGVDRSVDPVALSGLRTALITKDLCTIIDCIAYDLAVSGKCPDFVFVNDRDYVYHAAPRLQIRGRLPDYIPYYHPGGPLQICPDPSIPSGTGYVITSYSWAVDSNTNVLFCTDPGANGVFTFVP